MLGEYTLQLNLGCAREADELYPMPEAAVAVGVHRIGHAAAEFQHQRAFVGVVGGTDSRMVNWLEVCRLWSVSTAAPAWETSWVRP